MDPAAISAIASYSQPIGAPHARAGLLVSPWIAAAAGDWERALVPPPQGADPATTAFVRQNRALLLEHRRRYDEAEAELSGTPPTPRRRAARPKPAARHEVVGHHPGPTSMSNGQASPG